MSEDSWLAYMKISATSDGGWVSMKATCSACDADFTTELRFNNDGMSLEDMRAELEKLQGLWTVHVFTVHRDEWFISTRRTNQVTPQT
jgi:hypothetical protein